MAFDIAALIKSLSQMMGGGDNGMTMPNATNTSMTDWQPPDVTGTGSGLDSLLTLKNGQAALGGISALSGIMNSAKASKLASDQFKFTKDVTNTNLGNQIKSYNTALADRANSRAFTQNQDQSVADDYMNKNRLTRY